MATKTDFLMELHGDLRANYGFWDEEKDRLYKRILKEMLSANGEVRTRQAVRDCIKRESILTAEKLWSHVPPKVMREGRSEVLHERYLGDPDCGDCAGSGFKFTETQQGNTAVYACGCRENWRMRA